MKYLRYACSAPGGYSQIVFDCFRFVRVGVIQLPLDVSDCFCNAVNMTDTDPQKLIRLSRYVMARRQDLGYPNRADLAEAMTGHLTDRTLSDIENGTREVSTNTYVTLERALHWAPGSIDLILAGQEPIEKAAPTTASTQPLEQASFEAIIDEAKRRPEWTSLLVKFGSAEIVQDLKRRLDYAGLKLADESGWRALQAVEEAGLTHPPTTTRERGNRKTMTVTGTTKSDRAVVNIRGNPL